MLEALEDGGATTNELMSAVNLGKGRIEAMLKVLDVEGAVAREGTKWVRIPSDWEYEADRYAKVTALRRREQQAMAAFGADGRCLMRTLQEELDDPAPEDCGVCAVCTAPRFAGELDPRLAREAALYLRSRPLGFEAKKMAPDAEGKMKKLPEDVRAEDGRALARLGDGGWDPLIQQGRRAGRFDDELVGAAAEAVQAWRVPVKWVAAVPSQAQRPARARLRAAPRRRAPAPVPPAARAHRRPSAAARDGQLRPAGGERPRRVRASPASPRRRPGLLVDDIRFSGWTLSMVAGQLRRRGAPARLPVRARHRVLDSSQGGGRSASPTAACGGRG